MKTLSITGHLGHDPRLRQIANGDPVLNCSVGVSDRRKNPQTGEWENVTIWIDVTLFGQRGKWLSENLRKGMRVGASGEMTIRSYDARDGTARQQIEIIARDIEPLERLDGNGARAPEHRERSAQGSYGRGRQQEQDPQDLPSWGGGGDPAGDDIPFAPVSDIEAR